MGVQLPYEAQSWTPRQSSRQLQAITPVKQRTQKDSAKDIPSSFYRRPFISSSASLAIRKSSQGATLLLLVADK
jgi:hypothetical protein